jgi:hypothetical protein
MSCRRGGKTDSVTQITASKNAALHIGRTIAGDLFQTRVLQRFSKGATAMTHSIAHPASMLSAEELDHVSGGFKTDPNYVSKDVIDARGGQAQLLCWTFTFDVNGKVSSIS